MGKLKNLNELNNIVKKWREKGKKVVFANGCFDILHVGHIRYLKEAKELGDLLIVAINSDSSAKKLKGDGRPVTPENERAEIVAAIEYVDYVTLFNEPNVSNLLLTLKPDIHAKGTDYTEDSVPEADTVRAYGGRVAITGDKKERSSTEIIKKLNKPQTNTDFKNQKERRLNETTDYTD
ncbi:MAG: D-glycero-beta-D-manno-heptose 1-phosphate adenylyltransferase [Nitrospinae bacterium]|nr:D-glycero-beta-D-manno-heptose 1-phosphate adenylyltransferase [Nitrospinota bacterium]